MDNSFTTVDGRTVKCRPVSNTLLTMALTKIEQEFRARGEPLAPPTYTVKLMLPGGEAGEETHPHDAQTLDVPGDEAATKANHAAWGAYQSATERLAEAQNAKREWLWLMAGLDFQLPADDAWATEQAGLFGIEVPTEPQARRMHYIKTVLLPTPEDYFQALERVTILSLSGAVEPEVVRASIRSFRHSVPGAAPAGDQPASEPVGAQPAI